MTEGPAPGRRARNRAARAAFASARNHGLVRRHALKLQHLAERRAEEDAPDVNGPAEDRADSNAEGGAEG